MRVIIAGSRDITNRRHTLEAIRESEASGMYITEIVSGMSAGTANMIAEAKRCGLRVFIHAVNTGSQYA